MSVIKKKRVGLYNGVAKEIFEAEISPERKPTILRELDIGSACVKWTPEYLAQQGGERTVKVHVCHTGKMDFIHKNFTYR